MDCRRKAWGWLLMVGCAAGTNAAPAQTISETPPQGPMPRSVAPSQGFVPAPVPPEELTPQVLKRVRAVLEHPALSSRGPLEALHCRPGLYYWLLDHPDQAVKLCRGVGAKCTDILSNGEGSFCWNGARKGEVHWQAVLRTSRQRIW